MLAQGLRVEIVQDRIGMETMSTLLEMAETIRLAESPQGKEAKALPRTADIYTKERIKDLCELFETTPWGLCCALESVGSDPAAIGRFLRSRNAAPSNNNEYAVPI
jgi:hypothetical protein